MIYRNAELEIISNGIKENEFIDDFNRIMSKQENCFIPIVFFYILTIKKNCLGK